MKRYLDQRCEDTPNACLIDALAEYMAGRDTWVTDAKGNSRPQAERHFGICAICGESLAVHFLVTTNGKIVDITPAHPKYAAVRDAFTTEKSHEGATIVPRYFCESALRPVGRLPIRLAPHENPQARVLTAPMAAEALLERKRTEARIAAEDAATAREREAARPAATTKRVKGGI